MPGEHTKQRRCERAHRAQDALRIINDALLPNVRAEDFAIDDRRETSFLAQVSDVITVPVHVLHHHEVNDQQAECDDCLSTRSRLDEDEPSEEVTNRDALQDARNANRREMKVWKAGKEFAEQKNYRRAIGDFQKELLEANAAC